MIRISSLKQSTPILFILVLFISSCNDDCGLEPNLNVDQDQLERDIRSIDAYLSENGIEAEEHPSGIRYVISDRGEGPRPSLCNQVTVTYEGRLIRNGDAFDSAREPVSFGLENLIPGWQIGIPLIARGGRITLYIPSVYAYGERGSGSAIPPNSNLQFEIRLVFVR